MDLTPTTLRPSAPPDDPAPDDIGPGELAPDWSTLVAIAAARAAASPTAIAQARLIATGARPGGSFAPFVAIRLTDWRR